MNDLQKEILKVFKEFDRICRKNNLKYFAIGGTCIGAIRHSGFIPWDDDLDVAMPLPDYLRFMECANTELVKPYELYISTEYQHGNNGYIKIHNSETAFIESSTKDFKDRYMGVFIDIMPISALPMDKQIKEQYMRECTFLKKMDYWHRYHVSGVVGNKAKVVALITAIIRIGKKFNYYSDKLLSKMQEYSYDECEEVLFSWRIPVTGNYKNVFPAHIFQECMDVRFEDTLISVPKEYDQYLTMDFGDYMKLPPEEKRVPLHDYYVLDFNKSYKDYL